jgi:ribosomal protein S18 acetylase RimI-like enzyme
MGGARLHAGLVVRYEADVTDEIVIRPATEDDGDFVAQFASALLEFGSPAWKDSDALAPRFRKVLANAVNDQDPRAAVLIAQDGQGNRLGFISLKVRQEVTGGERAHVADLAVSEGSRRVGAGRALMRAAEAWARERQLSVIGLDVWSTNVRAIAFYRRLGYRPESLHLIRDLA